jgi:hypothetical protein
MMARPIEAGAEVVVDGLPISATEVVQRFLADAGRCVAGAPDHL